MKKEVGIIIAVALLLIIPIGLTDEENPVTVNSMGLEWRGEQVNLIARFSNPYLVANLKFELESQQDLGQITVDASQLNLDPSIDYTNLNANCQKTDNIYNCQILGINIYTDTPNPSITIKENGAEIANQNLDLTIDTSNPTLESATSQFCKDETCYISPNIVQTLQLTFTGSNAGFSLRNNVYFRLGSKFSGVSSCEDSTCIAYITPEQCTTSNKVNLNLFLGQGDPARDDAGNIVAPAQFEFTCDSQPPRIENIEITNDAGSEIIADSDILRVKVEATETTSSEIEIIVESEMFEERITQNCESSTSDFICQVDIQQTNTMPGDQDLNIKVRDLAGNTNSIIETARIFEESDREIDFWSVEDIELSSSTLNLRNLVYSRDIYAQIKLKTQEDVVVHDATATGCSVVDDGRSGEEGNINSMRVLNFDNDSLYVKFNVQEYGSIENNRYEDYSRLLFNCGFEVNSRTTSRIYSIPEIVNSTIQIGLTKDQTLDGFVREERLKIQEEYETEKANLESIIKSMNTITKACEIGQTIIGINAAMSAVSQIYSGVANSLSWVPGKGQGLAVSAGAFEVSVAAGSDVSNKAVAAFMTICKLATCDTSLTSEMFDRLGVSEIEDYTSFEFLDDVPVVSGVADTALGYENPSDALNPYKSEIVAWTQLCVPAILHHREEKLLTKCEYAECLSDGIDNIGLSVSECAYNKAYAECIRTSSNLVNAFPWTAIMQEMGQVVSGILKDPMSFVSFGYTTLICGPLPPTIGIVRATCLLNENVQSLTSGVSIVLNKIQVMANVNDLFNPESATLTKCQGIFSDIDLREGFHRATVNDTAQANRDLLNPRGFNRHSQTISGDDLTCDGGHCILKTTSGRTIKIKPELNNDNEIDFLNSKVDLNGKGYVELESILKRRNNNQQETTQEDQETTQDDEEQEATGEDESEEEPNLDNLNNNEDIDDYLQELINSQSEGEDFSFDEEGNLVLESLSQRDLLSVLLATQEGAKARKEFNEQVQEQYSGAGVNSSQIVRFMNYNSLNEEEREEMIQNMLDNEYEDELNELKEERNEAREELVEDYCDDNVSPDLKEACEAITINDMSKESPEFSEEIEEIESKFKKEEEKLKKKIEKAIEREYIKNVDIQRYRNLFGDPESDSVIDRFAKTTRTAFGTARSIKTIRNWFGTSDPSWSGGSTMNVAGDFVEDITDLEALACEHLLNTPKAPEGGGRVINYGQGSSIVGGAYIAARMYSVTDIPDVQDKYTYSINGGVSSVKRDGLRFKLELRSDERTTDITQEAINENYYEVNMGTPVKISNSNVLIIEDTHKYDQACMVFLNNDLTRYFDTAGSNQREICQEIEEET